MNICRSADYLPRSLTTLSLSDNELSDISHIVQLSCLPYLQRLSLSGNPFLLPCHQLGVYVGACVFQENEYVILSLVSSHLSDHKLFVLCCCAAVKVLDSVVVAEVDRYIYLSKLGMNFVCNSMNYTHLFINVASYLGLCITKLKIQIQLICCDMNSTEV